MAKAYARAPVLTVNGSDDGFDGFRLDFFINHIIDEDVHNDYVNIVVIENNNDGRF